jgi:hypothetical protein
MEFEQVLENIRAWREDVKREADTTADIEWARELYKQRITDLEWLLAYVMNAIREAYENE